MPSPPIETDPQAAARGDSAPAPIAVGTASPPTDSAARPALKYAALRNPAAHARFWLVVTAGLVLDLWSKEWAFHTLRQGGHWVLIPNVLEFHTTLNPGALFGIGAGHTELFLIASLLALGLVIWMFAQSIPRQWMMQIALGAILAGALGNMYDRVTVQLIPFGIQTAQGPVGRYYVLEPHAEREDQIILTEYPPTEDAERRVLHAAALEQLHEADGYVRDFIKIPTRWWGEREIWPWVFNVADMLLVGGVSYLALRLLLEGKQQPATAAGTKPKVDGVADET